VKVAGITLPKRLGTEGLVELAVLLAGVPFTGRTSTWSIWVSTIGDPQGGSAVESGLGLVP
jgi:hypothetical protein